MAPSTFHTVLVTGANSYFASGIIDKLLEVQPGTKIHAAVRREASIAALKARYGSALSAFVTPNILLPDAYIEAARGCDAIFHVASPLITDWNDTKKDVLDPAVQGCLSALRAAASEPRVKRVVLSSSTGAVMDALYPEDKGGFFRPGHTYTEADWNPCTYEEAAKYNTFSPCYPASKGLAERAAWDFMEREKPQFDLVAINPSNTVGPTGQHFTSQKDVSFTLAPIARFIDGDTKEIPFTYFPFVVTIDEVSQAHVKALLLPEAGGKRFLVHNQHYDWQMVVDVIHREFKDEPWIANVPKGEPGKHMDPASHFEFSNKASKDLLGVQYGDWEKALVAFVRQYAEDRKRWIK